MDLEASLQEDAERMENTKMAHIRALSFAIPSASSMEDWAKKWRSLAVDAGGKIGIEEYLFDEDDDDDDDDDEDWDPEILAAASAAVGKTDEIVSPFDPSSKSKEEDTKTQAEEELALTIENVDKVLDEVRPYLIADGGNVAVEDVKAEEGQVFLKLEGACGTLPF